MEQQQIRSFIAIELPPSLKENLLGLQDKFKSAGFTFVKWVASEGIHLTLKFLGSVPESKIPEIIAGMTRACSGIAPFILKTSELGVFPNIRCPSVFWLGVTGDIEAVCRLQKCIDDELKPMGFIPEKRQFTPHLTLARLRETASLQNRKDFGDLVAKTHFCSETIIEVRGINLMRSQLKPTGAVYTKLEEVKLNSG
jgi:RNA 2',3'-cyclic 3'-phosphodiesterase